MTNHSPLNMKILEKNFTCLAPGVFHLVFSLVFSVFVCSLAPPTMLEALASALTGALVGGRSSLRSHQGGRQSTPGRLLVVVAFVFVCVLFGFG